MNNDEKNTNIPQQEPILPGDAAGEDSADAFLEQLYSDSLQDLTSDFDTLLKEFQSIDPDDPAVGPVETDPAQMAQEQTPDELPGTAEPRTQEMEDIYSYSDHEQAPRMSFSESVQQAMDAEEAEAVRAEAEEDAFNLSLDQLDGTESSFADAVEQASLEPEEQRTQIYSADAVRQAADYAAPVRPEAPKAPAKPAAKPQQNGKKRKRSLLPQKNDSTFEIFRKVLFLVSMVVVVVCLGIIANTYLIQPAIEKNRQSEFDDLLANGVSDEESFKEAYGDTELPAGARYNLAQFYAKNQDFYGYLEIPGTGVSTPVVQGKDNKEYLHKNFFGESTKYGVPFVNYQNTYAALDYNTSIFGHNMEYDDLVFGELEKYRKIDGFKKAPLIHLETMYADYTFKIYAVFLTDSDYDSSGWFFDYIFTQLKDENECREYIAELDQRKLYSTGVDILPTDKLLTLSTCAYDFSTERLVVVGRLVREGESAEVDVSKAVANNNPRYPDKYYQRKGISNPYTKAAKWIPNA